MDDLIQRALAGERRAIGRLLTVAERGGEPATALTTALAGRQHGAHVIGVTGAPGAGKSTLVAGLVGAMVDRGERPAVLAVDPSSPLTGGAILGDRVRMASVDSVAFVRSIATRGHAGGLALAVPGATRVFDATGHAPIVIETVGVGQVEVDVTAATDTAVVVVTPGMGDAVQANKAGLLEVADVFVVNKADLPGAGDARRDLELMLELGHVTGQEDAEHRPPIVMVDAIRGTGIDELLGAVDAHRELLDRTGRRAERRRRRLLFELRTTLELAAVRSVDEVLSTAAGDEALDAVLSDASSQQRLVEDLTALLFSRGR